jgi:predicted transcriptional regulator
MMLLVLPMCLIVACGANKPAANKAEPAVNAPAAAAAPSGDQIGVPECDEFITKYEACVQAKVPEAARATVASSLTQWRDAWKQAASTAEGKAALAASCKQTLETTKQAMQSYGCAW